MSGNVIDERLFERLLSFESGCEYAIEMGKLKTDRERSLRIVDRQLFQLMGRAIDDRDVLQGILFMICEALPCSLGLLLKSNSKDDVLEVARCLAAMVERRALATWALNQRGKESEHATDVGVILRKFGTMEQES